MCGENIRTNDFEDKVHTIVAELHHSWPNRSSPRAIFFATFSYERFASGVLVNTTPYVGR